MESFSSDLYKVFEAIYKEHKGSAGLCEIPKFSLKNLDLEEFQNQLQRDVLVNATSLYKNLTKTNKH